MSLIHYPSETGDPNGVSVAPFGHDDGGGQTGETGSYSAGIDLDGRGGRRQSYSSRREILHHDRIDTSAGDRFGDHDHRRVDPKRHMAVALDGMTPGTIEQGHDLRAGTTHVVVLQGVHHPGHANEDHGPHQHDDDDDLDQSKSVSFVHGTDPRLVSGPRLVTRGQFVELSDTMATVAPCGQHIDLYGIN